MDLNINTKKRRKPICVSVCVPILKHEATDSALVDSLANSSFE